MAGRENIPKYVGDFNQSNMTEGLLLVVPRSTLTANLNEEKILVSSWKLIRADLDGTIFA